MTSLEVHDAALARCQTLDDVRDRFMAAVAPFGYTVAACGAFLQTRTGPRPFFFFQNWPQEWIALYSSRDYAAIDYSVAEARRRLAPFTWGEARAERVLSRAEQDLWDEAVSWGWEDGLSVPIHGPGGYFAIVTMGGPARAMPADLRRHLHMLALATHDRCRTIAGLPLVERPAERLSSREIGCLRWVAAGKTDWEIAAILGLGESTVKTHVDEARRKLGARSRAQAVALMILNGLE